MTIDRRTFTRSAALSVAAMALAGQTACFGSFTATRKLYGFNASFDNAIVQWVVFIVMCAIPVYEVGLAVDVLILNTLEFWTGSNPLAERGEPTETTVALLDGVSLRMRRVDLETMEIELRRGTHAVEVVLRADESGASVVRDARQTTEVVARGDGAALYDGGKLVRTYTAAEVGAVNARIAEADFAAVAAILDARGPALAAR